MLEWLQLSISPRLYQECFLVQLCRHLLSYHTGYCGDIASPLRLVTRPCSSIQHARHLLSAVPSTVLSLKAGSWCLPRARPASGQSCIMPPAS